MAEPESGSYSSWQMSLAHDVADNLSFHTHEILKLHMLTLTNLILMGEKYIKSAKYGLSQLIYPQF